MGKITAVLHGELPPSPYGDTSLEREAKFVYPKRLSLWESCHRKVTERVPTKKVPRRCGGLQHQLNPNTFWATV